MKLGDRVVIRVSLWDSLWGLVGESLRDSLVDSLCGIIDEDLEGTLEPK